MSAQNTSLVGVADILMIVQVIWVIIVICGVVKRCQ